MLDTEQEGESYGLKSEKVAGGFLTFRVLYVMVMGVLSA